MLQAFDVILLSVHREGLEKRDDIAGDLLVVNGVAYLIEDGSNIVCVGKPGPAFLEVIGRAIYRNTRLNKNFEEIVKDLEEYFEQSEKTPG